MNSLLPVKNYIHLRNHPILPFNNTVLLGRIDITVEAYESQDGIERVEFYLSNDLQEIDYEAPYSWTWKRGELFRHRFRIQVIAFDNDGDSYKDEISVRRFF